MKFFTTIAETAKNEYNLAANDVINVDEVFDNILKNEQSDEDKIKKANDIYKDQSELLEYSQQPLKSDLNLILQTVKILVYWVNITKNN